LSRYKYDRVLVTNKPVSGILVFAMTEFHESTSVLNSILSYTAGLEPSIWLIENLTWLKHN